MGTALVFEVQHKYVANDLNILNMSYVVNGFIILEITLVYWK